MNAIYTSVYRRIKHIFKPLGELLPSAGILVHPCLIDDKLSIVYEEGLKKKDPDAFRYVSNYARLNKLQLKEDQRSSFERVNHNRRKNFMPMMALGASMLFSKPVIASQLEDLLKDKAEITIQLGSEQLDENRQDELVKDLLNWVGKNSSFNVSSNELPTVLRVSEADMLRVVFKNMFPKAIDAKKLGINGLYNFKDKTIYLLDSLDLDSEKGKGILLHELVHYLQYEHGNEKHVNCKNELERLAYLLESDYLDDHGHMADFSNDHVNRVSRCS